MIVVPAVDIREGACVQLVGGELTEERVRLENPVAVALDWAHAGFRRLHVVDLDAATGNGSNEGVIEEIIRDFNGAVQVGGGVRTGERVEALLEAGAAQVIVGTRALEEPDWLTGLAASFPGAIIVATDVRERRVVTRGWARTLPLDILDVVADLSSLELGGLLVTAVHLEGQMRGTDLSLMEDVAEASPFPVYASGGITTVADLRALEHRGLYGAVIGMALYTGALDPRAIAGDFAE